MSLIAALIELAECGKEDSTKEKRRALARKIKTKKKDTPAEEIDNTKYAGKADGWTSQKGW